MFSVKNIRQNGRQIKDFQYSCQNDSYIEPTLKKYLWQPLQSLLSSQITPNLITISGLLLFFVCFGIHWFLYQSYFFLALGIFIFQTTDGIDGIHARNTNQATPSGLLVDHLTDSVVLVTIIVSIFDALHFRNNNFYNIMLLVSVSNAILNECTWSMNLLYFRKGHLSEFDASEFQMTFIILHIVSELWGNQIWDSYYLGYVAIIILNIVSAFDIYQHCQSIVSVKHFTKIKKLFQTEILQIVVIFFAMNIWFIFGEIVYMPMYWTIFQCYSSLFLLDILIKTVLNYPKLFMENSLATNKFTIIPQYFYPLFCRVFLSIFIERTAMMDIIAVGLEFYICAFTAYYIWSRLNEVANILQINILIRN